MSVPDTRAELRAALTRAQRQCAAMQLYYGALRVELEHTRESLHSACEISLELLGDYERAAQARSRKAATIRRAVPKPCAP